MSNKKPVKNYCLKKIVAARYIAELVVLVLFIFIPVPFFFIKAFFVVPLWFRIIISCLSPIAASILYNCCQIPWKVNIHDTGLELVSLGSKQHLLWSDLSKLKLKTNFGWRHYVITHKQGESCFPAMLDKADELVELIRSKLPDRGRWLIKGDMSFNAHHFTLVVEFIKALLQIIFIIMLWSFFIDQIHSSKSTLGDTVFVFFMALVISSLLLWRVIITVLACQQVTIKKSTLSINFWRNTKEFALEKLVFLGQAPIFYPEGLLIKAENKTIFLPAYLESFDELADELKGRLPTAVQKK